MFELILFGGLTVLLLKIFGHFFDQIVERKVKRHCPQYDDGVLEGAEPFGQQKGQKALILFVHGFTDHPQVFEQVIEEGAWNGVDYWVPLLPFHGRGLRGMRDFDPVQVENYLKALVEAKSREYDHLVLVGQSLGGSLLIRLADSQGWDPERVRTVLMAPAVFLYSDSWQKRIAFRVIPIFLSYWKKAKNALGTRKYPTFRESALAYYVTPSLRHLHIYCQKAEKILSQSKFPHTVLVAKDDKRVDAKKLSLLCSELPNCQFSLLREGGHLLYDTKTAPEVARHISRMLPTSFNL